MLQMFLNEFGGSELLKAVLRRRGRPRLQLAKQAGNLARIRMPSIRILR